MLGKYATHVIDRRQDERTEIAHNLYSGLERMDGGSEFGRDVEKRTFIKR